MIQGTCHCGSVTWSYPLKLESLTACNCTLCRRYGALWAYGFLDEGITVAGATTAYSRGSRINDYHFCQTCGGMAYYQARSPDTEGRTRIAVNIRMAVEPEALMKLPIDHFDGLDTFEDQPRDGRQVKELWY